MLVVKDFVVYANAHPHAWSYVFFAAFIFMYIIFSIFRTDNSETRAEESTEE